MTIQTRALCVHLLTASGSVFAMLALLAAVQHTWPAMFLWLLGAFVVDGIDGPLARKYDVLTNAPRFDGALLDLIIDYLTYVFIPAFALFQSGLLHGAAAWLALIVITFGSALYFADNRMKTADNSFSGFPGCWNMVVLVVFAVEPSGTVILPVILALALAMFLPVKFIHPVRTRRWRAPSLAMAALWTGAATLAVLHGFSAPNWLETLLVVSALYLLGAGAAQQILPSKDS